MIIVGIGELVWDLFPQAKLPGGAPSNFAFHAACLGDEGIVVSAVGQDELGQEALRHLRSHHLSTRWIQQPAGYATGTVKVTVDSAGQPTFEIAEPVAWDFLRYTRELKELVKKANAVCFGSLAQRSQQSRQTTLAFLDDLSESTLKVFDANLRQDFFNTSVLEGSLLRADILKVNDEELQCVCNLLDSSTCRSLSRQAARLASRFDLKLVAVTRGAEGSLMVDRSGHEHSHPGFSTAVADTVGAGDAFTAALVGFYLRGASLEVLNEVGNRMGSWVASQPGSTPPSTRGFVHQLLADLNWRDIR